MYAFASEELSKTYLFREMYGQLIQSNLFLILSALAVAYNCVPTKLKQGQGNK